MHSSYKLRRFFVMTYLPESIEDLVKSKGELRRNEMLAETAEKMRVGSEAFRGHAAVSRKPGGLRKQPLAFGVVSRAVGLLSLHGQALDLPLNINVGVRVMSDSWAMPEAMSGELPVASASARRRRALASASAFSCSGVIGMQPSLQGSYISSPRDQCPQEHRQLAVQNHLP